MVWFALILKKQVSSWKILSHRNDNSLKRFLQTTAWHWSVTYYTCSVIFNRTTIWYMTRAINGLDTYSFYDNLTVTTAVYPVGFNSFEQDLLKNKHSCLIFTMYWIRHFRSFILPNAPNILVGDLYFIGHALMFFDKQSFADIIDKYPHETMLALYIELLDKYFRWQVAYFKIKCRCFQYLRHVV